MKSKILIFIVFSICFKLFAIPETDLQVKYKTNSIYISTTDFNAEIKNTYEGMYQISTDKSKMIIFTESENDAPFYNSIFYIDGKLKINKFLFKNWQNAISDENIEYLLCQFDNNNPLVFFLYDIQKGKSTTVKLNIDNEKTINNQVFFVTMYRSLDKRFDFIVDLNFDSYVAAEYGFSIKSNKFEKLFDETSKSQLLYRQSVDRTDFELGLK